MVTSKFVFFNDSLKGQTQKSNLFVNYTILYYMFLIQSEWVHKNHECYCMRHSRIYTVGKTNLKCKNNEMNIVHLIVF